jgi:succinate-semialdehyde dehydrogenase/glutarate-semialdehyde dehydrogenase
VADHVDDARENGATVLTGGQARPDIGPFVYEPTILTDVTDEVVLCTEETFGPVVSIYEVSSEAEAIGRANDTDYGLNASVYSQDAERARDVAQQIECGTVTINDAYAAAYGSTDAPMGGMKDSGIGRRHGSVGLLKYTEAQTVAHQRTGPTTAPDALPNEWYAGLMTRLTRTGGETRVESGQFR